MPRHRQTGKFAGPNGSGIKAMGKKKMQSNWHRAWRAEQRERYAKPRRLDKLLEKAGLYGGQVLSCIDGSRHYLKGYLGVRPKGERRKKGDEFTYNRIAFRLLPHPDASV